MDRREMLGLLGAGAVGLSALSGREALAEDECCTLDAVHKECLEACSDCSRACDMAYHHCLTKLAEGKQDHAKALQFTSDCASFCALSASKIARQSPLMAHSCEACAAACKDTLAVVGKMDSAEMKGLAKSLEKCEKSCRAMVKSMGTHKHEA